MAELTLKVAADRPLAVTEGAPGPLESVAGADGVVVSQALLLSEGFIYVFTISVAAGIGANAATEAVKALIGRLATKNRGTRFTLEEEEMGEGQRRWRPAFADSLPSSASQRLPI